ncbi:MAG: trimeric autotransporter adhesin, partial [Verrucomicrobiota bacterium]
MESLVLSAPKQLLSHPMQSHATTALIRLIGAPPKATSRSSRAFDILPELGPRRLISYARRRRRAALALICLACTLALPNTVSSETQRDRKETPTIRMFDIGRGPHTYSFQLGREAQTRYQGEASAQQAIQAGGIQPRSMVSDDFNADGMGDLVIGYASSGGGVLSFRQGNVQAIAPTGDVFQGITQGRYPSPFLPEARLYSLPEAPDFLQVGDFNADGYQDVLAAARGGATLYLLPGDGRGNLGAVQKFQLPGSLTALRANDSRQPGVFTSLAVGLRTGEGAKALVYNKAGGGLAGTPESYSMPGAVTAFAFGRLDDDSATDLAAATTNQVIVIHGRSDQPADAGKNAPVIETQNLPFAIRGLAIGDFVFDRNHEREIAALSDDGTIYLSARGNPDTRPYTDAEKNTLRNLKRSYQRNNIDMETFRAESDKLVRPNLAGGWRVSQTIKSGVTPAANGSSQALFQRLDASTLPTDDLLVGNGRNNHLQMVRNEQDAAKLKIKATTKSVDLDRVSTDSMPLAAVSMRLGIDSRPGMVVLQADKIQPEVVILTPDAVFTVNSNADLADDVPTAANAVCHTTANTCTLRAAIMQS